MSVKAILDEKGRAVLTCVPQMTIRDAAKTLHEHHVGALVIIDYDEHIVGILAERDIVAAIAKSGADCLDKPLSTIMWTNVYKCAEKNSVQSVMAMMSQHRARHIPVEERGRLVGIISIGDVVKAHIRHIENEAEQIKAYIAG
jgi:CBS domain-containing protein